MELRVRASRPPLPLAIIEDALLDFDPASVVDIDPAHGLGENAMIDGAQLVALLDGIGGKVQPDEVEQQASVCCGGCSG